MRVDASGVLSHDPLLSGRVAPLTGEPRPGRAHLGRHPNTPRTRMVERYAWSGFCRLSPAGTSRTSWWESGVGWRRLIRPPIAAQEGGGHERLGSHGIR